MLLDVTGKFYKGSVGLELKKKNEERGVPVQTDNWGGTELPIIVTGGADGKIKFWSGHELMNAQYIEKEE